MITIDGSVGEGGGQILRSALALSMITGRPFAIEKIRAKRAKPGLLRQHLTCVIAAQQISGAKVTGAELRSTGLAFAPGPIQGGNYSFAIGTAGSTMLVFQTILPALLYANAPSRVQLSGGTHNPFAPTFDTLDRAFIPQLRRMGADVALTLNKPGFYPAGGGHWEAVVQPGALMPILIEAAGQRLAQSIRADVSVLPYLIAEREVATVAQLLNWPMACGQARTVRAEGHGNVVMVEIASQHVTEVFTAFGERNLTAEAVAACVVDAVRDYLAADAPVGPYLADQLLLPLALAGGGAFVTSAPTQHTATNIAVIEKFLPVRFEMTRLDAKRWRVSVAGG